MENDCINKTLNFNEKEIKKAPFKRYLVLQDFTLDKVILGAKR
jgi:hypothetical protein